MAISEVYNCDCNEFMATCKDKQFDLAIVDPPYGIGVMSMNYTTSGAIRTHGYSAAKRKDYRKQSKWDVSPDQNYFNELFRISKNQIIWGGNYFSEMIPSSKAFIIWDKRCIDSMSNDFSDCEYAWCSIGVARMFRFIWNGMIQGNMSNKENRTHPTQKPVPLYKWLLKNYAKEGDTIFDSHGGSMSSVVACIDGGFPIVCCELDKDYYETGKKRVMNHMAQLDCFIERPEIIWH